MRILRTTERHGAGWREQNFITNSEEAMLDCEGISIEVVPVWKWLLQFSMNNKNEDYV